MSTKQPGLNSLGQLVEHQTEATVDTIIVRHRARRNNFSWQTGTTPAPFGRPIQRHYFTLCLCKDIINVELRPSSKYTANPPESCRLNH